MSADHRSAPVLRAVFTVRDIDEALTKLGKRGAQLGGEVVRHEDAYRLRCIRGPNAFSLD